MSELQKDFNGKSTQQKRYIVFGIVLLIVILAGIIGHTASKDYKEGNVEEVVNKGLEYVDKRMEDTGISQHLDTLSSLIYFKPEYFERLNEGMDAIDDYMNQIKQDYSEEELSEIREKLTSHQNEKQKEWGQTYNKMKEAYDRSVMQGD